MRNSRFIAVGAVIALVLTATGALGAPSKTRRLGPARLSPHAFHDDQGQVAQDALTRALKSKELDRGEYALARARSLFHLGKVREQYGDVAKPAPRDATLILRDLVLAYRQLSDGDR
ncbi:MAG TPA: hypothetical protein VIG64_07780, partial [Actinomycetota bacterium]